MLAAYMLELTHNTNVTIQRLMCVSCVQYIAINILLQHFDLGNSVQRDGTAQRREYTAPEFLQTSSRFSPDS